MRNKILGGLIGLAVGDALGVSLDILWNQYDHSILDKFACA